MLQDILLPLENLSKSILDVYILERNWSLMALFDFSMKPKIFSCGTQKQVST